MTRLRHVLIVTACVAAPLTACVDVAGAAPIRECGKSGRGIYNVTARSVSCETARRFARRVITDPACAEDRYCRYRGWRCTHYYARGENDMRCLQGTRVIRFQY
jgi:hypothetical protein